VPLLEKAARLDRSEGDVHPGGNPHIQTDPRNIARVAGPLAARLAELDPANAAYYQARYKAFADRWTAAIANWEKQAAPLKGAPILVQHKAFTYLEAWLGLNEVAALEPKPGVEPTTAHLTEVLATLQRQPVKDGNSRRLPERPRVAMDRGAREDQCRHAAIHRRRRRCGQGPVRSFRRHRRAPSQGVAVNISAAEISILVPAFVAGLLVTATHVPLGTQVLARGIVFIDLAIAQIAGCGVLLADQLGFEPQGAAVQVAALTAAIAGALLLTWTERRWPDVQEAVIGVTFVLGATGSVLLLASNVHGSEHLRDLLVGQILWVQWQALGWTATVYALVLIAWFGFRDRLGRTGFYVLFALAVTVSVQLVGLYLVFASLIVPPLATRRMVRHRLAAAWGIGVAGYAFGLVLSTAFDLPTGPVIVWMLAILALLSDTCLAARRGAQTTETTAAGGRAQVL
jgi:zinc/manganese transport system permease protein